MRWPSFRKKIKTPMYDLQEQIAMALKSLPYPQIAPNWRLYAQRSRWDTETAIVEGYNASAVVYSCIEKRASAVASVPWKAYYNGEHEPDSDLQKLIDNPNDDQSWYELMYELVQQKDLSGNAYFSEVRGGVSGLPFQMWLLPSQYISIKPSRERLIGEYWYQEATKQIFPADDVIHIRNPNPNSRYFGMPRLMAAGQATDIDREAGAWQKGRLQNKVASDLMIKVPEGTTEDVIENVRKQVKERYEGSRNAGKPLVTSGDVHNLNPTAADLDFINGRKAVWGEVCAAFGVPMAMLGFTESVNLANAKEMKRLFWEDTIIPELTLIKRQLDHQLAKEFGDGWTVEYDISNVSALKEDFAAKVSNAEVLMRLGYTRNEINEALELGFEEDASGNVRYEPTGLLPIGADTGSEEDQGEETTDEEKQRIYRLVYGDK